MVRGNVWDVLKEGCGGEGSLSPLPINIYKDGSGQRCMMMLQIKGMRKFMASLELLDSLNGSFQSVPTNSQKMRRKKYLTHTIYLTTKSGYYS